MVMEVIQHGVSIRGEESSGGGDQAAADSSLGDWETGLWRKRGNLVRDFGSGGFTRG